MALIDFFGFDDNGDNLPPTGKWTTAAAFSAVNTTNARFAGIRTAICPNNPNVSLMLFDAAFHDDVFIVGLATRNGNLTDSNATSRLLLALYGDGGVTQHTSLTVGPTGIIFVKRGTATGTILAQSAAGAISENVWQFVELKVTLHDSTGTVDVMVDGVSVISATGLDTKNAGTGAVFDAFSVSSMTVNANTRLADIYVCNGLGASQNDFLGDCKVNTGFPTSDSTPEEWTRSTGSDSFALTDETPVNGDTDYIESATDGQITRMGMTDLTDTTHVVHGVKVTNYARKDDAGARSVRVGLFSDATLGNGADHALATSFTTYADIFPLDPDGNVAWTPTQFNAAFVQVEVRP